MNPAWRLRRLAAALAGSTPPQEYGSSRELRHLPEGQPGRPPWLASAGEGVAAYRPESGEIDGPSSGSVVLVVRSFMARCPPRADDADEVAVHLGMDDMEETVAFRVPDHDEALCMQGLLTVEAYCVGQRFELLPVTFAHGERAGSWPQEHGDPFDRMLAAQCALEGIPFATNDPKIGVFGVRTIW